MAAPLPTVNLQQLSQTFLDIGNNIAALGANNTFNIPDTINNINNTLNQMNVTLSQKLDGIDQRLNAIDQVVNNIDQWMTENDQFRTYNSNISAIPTCQVIANLLGLPALQGQPTVEEHRQQIIMYLGCYQVLIV
ncbi:hypothetical protein BU15DRAFT_60070 [Melanogaster broomeanus]|nr:hypothetical protein BU15DRAFT_60070 [Melanogaster broomeanus]